MTRHNAFRNLNLRHGPFRPGDRVFRSTYPPDHVLTLLDGPRISEAGTVELCGPTYTIVRFDAGQRETVNTKGLFKGEPPK